MREWDKSKTREEVPTLKNIYSRWTISKSQVFKKQGNKKSSKDLTQDLRDASGASSDPCTEMVSVGDQAIVQTLFMP